MVEVVKAGFYSTIQDLGRFGYRAYGVPISGVMDSYSATFANTILGNDPRAATIEMTMTGATLRFTIDTQICMSGADMSPKLNDDPLILNEAHRVKAGSILDFGRLSKGFRCYLAVKGGFNTEVVMKSRSFYKPVTEKSVLKTGDVLKIETNTPLESTKNSVIGYDASILEEIYLEVFKGPEYGGLLIHQQEQLLTTDFEVSRFHNRMAYQIGPKIKNHIGEMLTSPVLPGTVQLTASGQLIILARDCQTTGGYPRVLQLTEKAISILAQKQAGNTFKFRLTE